MASFTEEAVTQGHEEFSGPLLLQELKPDPRVFEVLIGSVSDPQEVISLKNPREPQPATVRLVEEGAGMLGLTDRADSKEWSGIAGNHTWLSTRLALHWAAQAAEKGHQINLQTILDGGLVSHAGRRQWDEAGWYPTAPMLEQTVTNIEFDPISGETTPVTRTLAESRRAVSNEMLGMRLIQGGVSDEALGLVVALGHRVDAAEFAVDASVYDSLEYRIYELADHRTGQDFGSIEDRMGVFLNGVFVSGDAEEGSRDQIQQEFRDILGIHREAVREGEAGITTEEAVARMTALGVSTDSARLPFDQFMHLMLRDVETEVMLEQVGIDVEDITPSTVPMQPWERDIRARYIDDARVSILQRLDELVREGADEATINTEFPRGHWWGDAARTLYALESQAAVDQVADNLAESSRPLMEEEELRARRTGTGDKWAVELFRDGSQTGVLYYVDEGGVHLADAW